MGVAIAMQKIFRLQLTLLAIASTITFALTSFNWAQAAEEVTTVNKSNNLKLSIPYNAVGIDVTPLWIAIETGIFKQYGIDVSPGGVMQSPTIVASMLSGETPFAISGPDAVISADLNGGDIVMLVSGSEKLLFTIYGTPNIQSVGDLKGKKIGVTQFGTTTDFIAHYVLKNAGMQPDKDATILPMGAQTNLLAALLSKRLDAAVLGFDVSIRANQLHKLDDFRIVEDMYNSDLLFYTGSLLAKKSWVKTHRNDTLNVVRAYVAGVAAVHNNKQAAVAALEKYTNTTDVEVLESSYASLLKKLPKVPIPRASVMQSLLDESKLPAAKKADPMSFIDPSFINELQQDGFIDSLYK
jgi:NitT/TauT family transport system substrate-binding protein